MRNVPLPIEQQPQEQEDTSLAPGMMPPMGPPMPDSSLHKWLIDQAIGSDELEQKLSGIEWDFTGEEPRLVQRTTPLMNPTGINNVMYLVRAYTGKGFQFTYFERRDIGNIMANFSTDLNLLLANNCQIFGIDRSNLDCISDMILDSIYATLMKALDGRLMRFLKDTATLSQVQHSQPGGGRGMTDGGTKRKWFGFF